MSEEVIADFHYDSKKEKINLKGKKASKKDKINSMTNNNSTGTNGMHNILMHEWKLLSILFL